MTETERNKIIKQLQSLAADRHDATISHILANDIIADLLKSLGYGDIVAAWQIVPTGFK